MTAKKQTASTDLDNAKARKAEARDRLALIESHRSPSTSKGVVHVAAQVALAQAAHDCVVAQYRVDAEIYRAADEPKTTASYVAELPGLAAAIVSMTRQGKHEAARVATQRLEAEIAERRERHNAWLASAGIKSRGFCFPALGGSIVEHAERLGAWLSRLYDEPAEPVALSRLRHELVAAKAVEQAAVEEAEADRVEREAEAERQRKVAAVAAKQRAARHAAQPPVDLAAEHRAEQERLAAAYDERCGGQP